jgi:hypothetical protein
MLELDGDVKDPVAVDDNLKVIRLAKAAPSKFGSQNTEKLTL